LTIDNSGNDAKLRTVILTDKTL